MKTVGHFTSGQWGRVNVMRASYATGAMAVLLQMEDGEPLATLSVNFDDSLGLPPDCFYLKNWSENELVMEDVDSCGLFKLRTDLPPRASGFVLAPVYQLTKGE